MKKLYLGIIRDHSGSMHSLAHTAKKDYNALISEYLKEEDEDLSIVVTTAILDGVVTLENILIPVQKIPPLHNYITGGMTPLFDGLGRMIDVFSGLPDAQDPNVRFMIMTLTDGAENGSRYYSALSLGRKIAEKQNLGNWTFTFRVPYGFASVLHSLNVPSENIHTWDGISEQSYNTSSIATSSAIRTYSASIKAGATSTDKFYTDLSNVSAADLQVKMTDISSQCKVFVTTKPEVIKPYIEQMLGHYTKGTVYYQLTKTEDTVQDYKYILISDKKSGAVYGGNEARKILGLPLQGNCKIAPGNHGQFEIFIQSTSINRKLPAGTKVVVYDPMSAAPPVATTGYITPVATKKVAVVPPSKPQVLITDKEMYELGKKDGRARRKQKFKSNPMYMKGYREGRTDR